MRHRLVLAAVAACVWMVAASRAEDAPRPPAPPAKLVPEAADYEHDRWGTSPREIYLDYGGYVVSFDSGDDDNGDGEADFWRIPHWVAHEIWAFPGDCIRTSKRPPWFTDARLAAIGVAPFDASYRYPRAWRRTRPNWFVRGHMAMKLLVERLGADAAWNTHSLMNAVPQRQDFNAGIWLDLEFLTGAWAQRFDKIWVVTGPVIPDGAPAAWIGEASELAVAIPEALFKIVIREGEDPNRPQVLAFLYPQMGPGYDMKDDYRHERFLVSVDEIEVLTGLDFLTALSPAAEREIEAARANELWPVSAGDFVSACR